MLLLGFLITIHILVGQSSAFTKTYYLVDPSDNTSCPNGIITLSSQNVTFAANTPAADYDAPYENVTCLTFNQYANLESAPINTVFPVNTSLSLIFAPGNHTLDSHLQIESVTNLTLQVAHTNPISKSHSSVMIMCTNKTGFSFVDISIVTISGLLFSECQEISVRSVDQLKVENCKLIDGHGMEFVNVINATVVNSLFVDLKAIRIIQFPVWPFWTLKAGGAIITFNSNLLIAGCQFEQNLADFGGAIYAEDGSISIHDSTFKNNSAIFNRGSQGGAIRSTHCSISILCCNFTGNTASSGGAILATDGDISISTSSFVSNTAAGSMGGMLSSERSNIDIQNSSIVNNTAQSSGGALRIGSNSILSIHSCCFWNNTSLCGSGGAINADSFHIIISIHTSMFSFNKAEDDGGGIIASRGTINIDNSIFIRNKAENGGAIRLFDTTIDINGSTFNRNTTARFGGAIFGCKNMDVYGSNFSGNSAAMDGGALKFVGCYVKIRDSDFLGNGAGNCGGALHGASSTVRGLNDSHISIHESRFYSNVADIGGAFFHRGYKLLVITVNNTIFSNNQASNQGGAIYTQKTGVLNFGFVEFSNNSAITGMIFISNSVLTFSERVIFSSNKASLYAFASNITFNGVSDFFENVHIHDVSVEEGGAFSCFQSQVMFAGIVNFFHNQIFNGSGGAILLSETILYAYGDVNISNNVAQSGGGIYAYQSDLNFVGRASIEKNIAIEKGGGIHAVGTTLKQTRNTLDRTILEFTENSAIEGGGIYMELNSKLYVIKLLAECTPSSTTIGCFNPGIDNPSLLLATTFTRNVANFGGALYISDNTCATNTDQSTSSECFLQDLAANDVISPFLNLRDFLFSYNVANVAGRAIFGGILDRCTVSSYAQIFNKYPNISLELDAISYLLNITDLQLDNIHSEISSQSVRVCFCQDNEPKCEISSPPKYAIKKGDTLKVSLVAVDQVRHPIPSSVRAFLSSDGGLAEGEDVQGTFSNCTELSFTVTSPSDTEQLLLYAEGPCNDDGISSIHLNIEFLPCTCPVGFVPEVAQQSNCICECDPCLFPDHVAACSAGNSSIQRRDNIWISYINATHEDYGSGSGDAISSQCPFLTYPYCPFDYCSPSNSIDPVWINLNTPSGSNAQCAFNRTGLLCGSCEDGLSLTFGSSRCMSCSNYWLALLIVFAVAGFALVGFLLVFNLTVAVGTVNGLIFYANILKSNRATFFPFQTPNFFTIFISWLNLDFGFVTCFYNGMDGYSKEWLQLVFPVYIIFLVALVIIACEYTTRIAKLFTHTNPVATLATLILLSYAKSIRVIIAAMSSATLEYPDGSVERVWLTDANVRYFQDQHIPLFLVALLILLVGILYTSLLISYQWLLRCPNRRALSWIKHARFYPFMDAYLAAFNLNHRYWTGLLLLICVILYVFTAFNVSNDPGNNLLAIIITLVCLLLFKESLSARIYKSWLLNALENSFILNLIVFSVGSLYIRQSRVGNQEALAYTSTSIAFITFLAILIYHTYAFVLSKNLRNKLITFKMQLFSKQKEEEAPHEIILVPNAVCTYNVVDAIPHSTQDPKDNTEITSGNSSVAVSNEQSTDKAGIQSLTIIANQELQSQSRDSSDQNKPNTSAQLPDSLDAYSPDSDQWGMQRETELQNFTEIITDSESTSSQ